MTSSSLLHPLDIPADEAFSNHDRLSKVFDSTFRDFDRLMKRHALFNLFFISLCAVEVILLSVFFVSLAQSLVLAVSLAIVFFTFFAYFTLRIYFQTKKPEQFQEIKERYLRDCKDLLNYQEGIEDHYKALANSCCKFANKLHAREYNYYAPPSWLSFLAPLTERISCWWHWKDVFLMKEEMLQEAVSEHIKLVKCHPTSLEGHASLANAYVMLSGLYIDPRTLEGYDEDRWIPKEKYTDEFDDKFRFTAERAIEEFQILCEYAPDDPWVHSQLAYSYHDLQMPLEEIKEYEAIRRLAPQDKDNLYKLGMLYFQQGMNAKGLRIYEELQKTHYIKAESLIKHYGKVNHHAM
jgi:tetratricopeptide (TPR) repeat protein